MAISGFAWAGNKLCHRSFPLSGWQRDQAGRQDHGRRVRSRRQIAFECSGLGAGVGLSPHEVLEVASIKGSLYLFARPRPEKYERTWRTRRNQVIPLPVLRK